MWCPGCRQRSHTSITPLEVLFVGGDRRKGYCSSLIPGLVPAPVGGGGGDLCFLLFFTIFHGCSPGSGTSSLSTELGPSADDFSWARRGLTLSPKVTSANVRSSSSGRRARRLSCCFSRPSSLYVSLFCSGTVIPPVDRRGAVSVRLGASGVLVCSVAARRCSAPPRLGSTVRLHTQRHYLVTREHNYISVNVWIKYKLDTSLEVFLHILSGSSEYDELPVQHNEENFNATLSKMVPYLVDEHRLDNPHVKANLRFQAHFSRLELPISDYVIHIIQAMIDTCANSGWLLSSLVCISFKWLCRERARYAN
ncbi:hypothetical protein J5N97_006323 [Dioscorea zingiberensis]|uniref:SEC63 domain-containing protein n=1 Tax=Dioscorea zingiberensis TaxID=325984 RepID=A0A9D5DCU5_9LILI|nr:hypothetical protein J5N97_006323 [Dioscorea zingiberensis]